VNCRLVTRDYTDISTEMTMWRLALIFIALSTTAYAQDYIPQLSATTGQEIGRAFRTDGKVPTKDAARNDKRDCILNHILDREAKRLALLARKDKAAGEVALLQAVTPCMVGKGWRLEVTGR